MSEQHKNQILAFIKAHSGLTLSTASKEGRPESAYVFFAVNDNLEFFILTNTSTEKYLNAKVNKEVALVITDEDKLITLQGKGQITEITSAGEDIKAFNAIIEVITKKVQKWPPPPAKIKDDGHVICKIKSTWLRLRDYAQSTDFVSDNIEYSA